MTQARLLPVLLALTAAVTPAAGQDVAPAAAVTAPIARFQDLTQFPPETAQAVFSIRIGAEWLWRMNQANGRFLSGLDPTLRLPLDGDQDLHQAFAARALAEAARFTGEERYAARAAQAVLALLALTRTDPALPGQRVPVAPSSRCNRVAFAAVTVLAIHALPDKSKLAEAEELTAFLMSRIGTDGALQLGDTPEEPPNDPEAARSYPGLALQAVVASYRTKPDETKRTVLARLVGHSRESFKKHPHPLLAATLIPPLAELAALNANDPAMAAAVFEMADSLCRCQYLRTGPTNPRWIGGFRTRSAESDTEPDFHSALCVDGLVAAVQLTRQIPDVTRYRSYRLAVLEGLTFARGLQFTEESTEHFEKGFRSRFLTGGVHLGPASGTVRIDATALLVTTQLRFLQSGAETAAK